MKNIDVRWLVAVGGILALPQTIHLALSGRPQFDAAIAGFVLGFCLAFVAVTAGNGRSRRAKMP